MVSRLQTLPQKQHGGLTTSFHPKKTHKSLKYVVLGGLLLVIVKQNLSFSYGSPNQNATLVAQHPQASPPKAPPHEIAEAGFGVQAPSHGSTNKKSSSASSPEDLNLANEATATGAALTKAQQEEAAKFSNLGLFISPGVIKKQGVSAEIVAHKRSICLNYIKTYAPIARQIMKTDGIPASITLAQGLLESNAGESKLAKLNNNHFGIKCFSTTCKKGHCSNMTDDSHKDFFRKFSTVEEGMKVRSQFLKKQRYAKLFQLKRTDYRGWSQGLQDAGYATAPHYASSLIKVIDAFQLYKFDRG